MAEYTIEGALQHGSEVLRRIEMAVRGILEAELVRRPDPDHWSVHEHVEHLVLVGGQILAVSSKLLARVEAKGGSADDATLPPADFGELVERSREVKLSAPRGAVPGGTVSVDVSLARLREIHEKVESLRPRLLSVSPHSEIFPHPAFGPLTLGQWIALLGVHEERHLKHIQRILGSDRPVLS
jgi:hypothetical protein